MVLDFFFFLSLSVYLSKIMLKLRVEIFNFQACFVGNFINRMDFKKARVVFGWTYGPWMTVYIYFLFILFMRFFFCLFFKCNFLPN